MREPMNERTVEELISAALAGDHPSWGELVARYDGMVHAMAKTYRLQDADAADVAQATWLRALERLANLRDPARFGGWLRTIAVRECLLVRDQGRREYLDPHAADHMVEPAPGPEAQVVDAEISRAVRAAVDTLGGRNRVLVEALFYRSRVDYAVTAQTAGMPVGSIGPTRSRTLRALRHRLERGGYGRTA